RPRRRPLARPARRERTWAADRARAARAGFRDAFPRGRSRGGHPRRRAPAAAGDHRPPRFRASRARHRELRPGHAGRIPDRGRDVPLDVVAAADAAARLIVAIDWDPTTRAFELRNDALTYILRVHRNGALGGVYLGPSLAPGRDR